MLHPVLSVNMGFSGGSKTISMGELSLCYSNEGNERMMQDTSGLIHLKGDLFMVAEDNSDCIRFFFFEHR